MIHQMRLSVVVVALGTSLFSRENDTNSGKRGIYESPPDRYVSSSFPAKCRDLGLGRPGIWVRAQGSWNNTFSLRELRLNFLSHFRDMNKLLALNPKPHARPSEAQKSRHASLLFQIQYLHYGLILAPILKLFNLVDVSDIFHFFCSGEWKGEFEAPGRGGGAIFYGKSQGGGGGLPGGWGRGGEGPGGCLRGIWVGGLNIFFGAEIPTKLSSGFRFWELINSAFKRPNFAEMFI